MTFQVSCRIDAAHPSLAGHFPGRPVVPGVVLLNRVEQAVKQWMGESVQLISIAAAKFTHPLLPDTEFSISLESPGIGKVKFTCAQGETVLATGSLNYQSDQVLEGS